MDLKLICFSLKQRNEIINIVTKNLVKGLIPHSFQPSFVQVLSQVDVDIPIYTR